MILKIFYFPLIVLISCSTLRDGGGDYYFSRCSNTANGGLSIPFSGTLDRHEFRPECAPDVLYSWQKEEKINWETFSRNPLRKESYLYTWRTPISTYAYGAIQIRLKLKKGVNFKWVIKNQGLNFRCPIPELEKTIYVMTTTYEKVVSEYLVCSSDVVESWSVFTKEAQLEAQNEYSYILKHQHETPQKYDAFGFGYGRTRLGNTNPLISSDSYFVNWDGKSNPWSNEILKERIAKMTDGPARIHYNEGIKADPEQHFRTNVRSYFELSEKQLKSISSQISD